MAVSSRFKHPDGTPLTTDELLHLIETNDRRFRVAQAVFMFVISGILVTLLFSNYQTIVAFQKQSEERRNAIEKIQQATKDSVDETERYIYCIAQFFASKDRANLIITDLDNCKITDTSSASTLTPAQLSGEPAPTSPYKSAPEATPWPATTPAPTPTPTTTPEPACRVKLPVIGCVLS